MRKIVFTVITLLTFNVNAQELKVVDNNTKQGIEHVMVYNQDGTESVQSNEFGKVSIKNFEQNSVLTFQHPSYNEFIININDLPENNIIILYEKIIEFDEVVIAANKWEQNKEEVPNEILSLSTSEIQLSQAQTTADLLEKTGQVFVQKSQLGGGSPTLRGFAANRVLIVVDGVRMNNAIFRSGNLQNIISIDPSSLQEAEVIFGPGSVIYGSDALGGVMDFHTIDPVYSINGFKVKGKTMLRYSSANEEKTGHIDLQLSGKRWGFVSSFTFSDYGDLKTGSKFNPAYGDFGKRFQYVDRVNGQDVLLPNENISLQRYTGFSQWNTINKLKYQLSEKVDLSYGLLHSNTSNLPRYDRLAQPSGNGLRSAEWYYGPQKWTMHRFGIKLTNKNALYNEAKVITTYQLFEESRHDRRFGDDRLRHQLEKVNVFSVNADFNKNLNKSEFYYGIEYTNNQVTSEGSRKNIVTGEINPEASRYPDGGSEYISMSGYVSYKYHFSNKLVSTLGARYNWVTLNGQSTDVDAITYGFDKFDINNSSTNGSIGFAYLPTKLTKIDIIASSGFRSPNIDDVGKLFELDNENGTPIVIIPNPELKPETAYNAELGVSHNFYKKVKLYVVGYYSYLSNAIVRGELALNGDTEVVINGVVSNLRGQVNTDKAYIYGGSATLNAQLPFHFYLNSSFTITQGKDASNNQPLRHTTPNFGKTTLGFKHEQYNLQFYVDYQGNRFRKDIPITEIDDKDYLYAKHVTDTNKDGSPAWMTFNFKTTVNLNASFTISAAVENIADIHYRTYSSGISAPGRNFMISLNARLN